MLYEGSDKSCPVDAEGGDTAQAFALATAKAFAAGGSQATAFADAYAAAIGQYGCDAIKPLLTRE